MTADRRRLGLTCWISIAVCAAVLLTVAALMAVGENKNGLDTALMLTGRWAFLLFWPAYAGAGLVLMVGDRAGFLKCYGREFGLAFAAVMLVHAGLIGWLCLIGAPPAPGLFMFFGPGLVFTYLLALFSVDGLQRRLGRKLWWWLRTIAMNYIAYAFASDFLQDPFGGGNVRHIVVHAPFVLLAVLGFAAYGSAQLSLARNAFKAT